MSLQKPVLVTGGTGLLGSHLVFSLISRGIRVRATYRKSSNRELLGKIAAFYTGKNPDIEDLVEWTVCDLCDRDAVLKAAEGAGHVYHCAATVSFARDDGDRILKNNVNATGNIVAACLENGVDKLCHVSSNSTFSAKDGDLSVSEQKEWDSGSVSPVYALSKHLSDEEVWKGIAKGLKAVIVCPTIIIGPGDWNRGSSLLFRSVVKGFPFYTDGIKSYVDVNDVVKAMTALMESNVSGEKFIVSSENLSNKEFFSLVAQSFGTTGPYIKIPRRMSLLAFPVIDIIQFATRNRSPLTRDILKVAWSKVGYDNSKIIRFTGISFTPINRSVDRVAEYYRACNLI